MKSSLLHTVLFTVVSFALIASAQAAPAPVYQCSLTYGLLDRPNEDPQQIIRGIKLKPVKGDYMGNTFKKETVVKFPGTDVVARMIIHSEYNKKGRFMRNLFEILADHGEGKSAQRIGQSNFYSSDLPRAFGQPLFSGENEYLYLKCQSR